MTTKKKTIIALSTVIAAIVLVAASIVGTIAYMTSASKVSNVFTVGNVFITLDESKVDSNGKAIAGERTDGNSYHLMPGKSYDKDPIITVAPDTESCYLFLVTRNDIVSIEASATTEIPGKPTMAAQMRENGWAIYKDTSVGSRVWVYCGTKDRISGTFGAAGYSYEPMAVCGTNKTASGSNMMQATQIAIFTEFHITTEQSANLGIYSGASVTINAVGIQSDSFGEIGEINSLNNAWAAVIAQYPYIQDSVNQDD